MRDNSAFRKTPHGLNHTNAVLLLETEIHCINIVENTLLGNSQTLWKFQVVSNLWSQKYEGSHEYRQDKQNIVCFIFLGL